jgi:hypothetical protein
MICTLNKIANPYLEEFEQGQYNDLYHCVGSKERFALTNHFSWAVPNQEAIDYLVSQSPIIEMGAGTGYWSKLISDLGGEVIAFDESPYDNDWCKNQWYEITKINSIDILANYPNHTLFLCWPPYDTPFAYNCLKAYRGNKLIFVGEGCGGCTGDDNFFYLLEEEWKEQHSIYIPQWFGMRDYLVSYKRK